MGEKVGVFVDGGNFFATQHRSNESIPDITDFSFKVFKEGENFCILQLVAEGYFNPREIPIRKILEGGYKPFFLNKVGRDLEVDNKKPFVEAVKKLEKALKNFTYIVCFEKGVGLSIHQTGDKYIYPNLSKMKIINNKISQCYFIVEKG